MKQKIKPVLRFPGSKYKKINTFIKILDIQKTETFIDLFGGSGIVGANVKHLVNCKVIINDFDHILPIKVSYAIKNMVSFAGLGNNFTKIALEYFNKRIDNGYWEKLKIYNDILGQCEIIHQDALLFLTNFLKVNHQTTYVFYIDPPYLKIDNLYKNNFNLKQHTELNHLLNKIKTLYPHFKFLISCNNLPIIRELYQDWNIQELEFSYSIGSKNNNKNCKKINELIISNI